METYRYLIQYVSDIRGIGKAKKKLRELEVYNTKFGAKVGQVTKVLSKNIQTSTKIVAKGATQHTRNITRVFRTASGQAYKLSRAVTTSGGKVIKTSEKLSKASAQVAKGFAAQTAAAGKLAIRAVAVIPIWLALRAAFMLVIRTISDAIRAFVDLDDSLARIRTVMHGTEDAIEVEMIAIKSQIVEASLDSRIALKELAEGFYFLKTANLSAGEAMAAFQPTVDLAIGTMNDMGQSARAVAGIYNTMGQYILEGASASEKFQHIADVLAYTYATQDVQLGELIESYTKMAPYVTGLKDSFLELTTMLGFLNTRLLRGGRTGRLTGRAILQLTKNSKKLAAQFGITFKGDEPIALLGTIRKIRDAMGKAGKITAEQGQIIQEVFATRGGVAIRLLIEHFEDLSDQIKDAIKHSDGFAKRMKEIRMGTIAGQMARVKNIIAILAEDFLSTAIGASDLADAIRKIGDALEDVRPIAISTGKVFAGLGKGLKAYADWIKAGKEALKDLSAAEAAFYPTYLEKRIELFMKYGALAEAEEEKDLKRRAEVLANLEKRKKLNEELITLSKKHFELLTKEERSKVEQDELKAIEKTIKLKEKEVMELAPASLRLQQLKTEGRKLENELEKEGLTLVDEIVAKEKHRIAIMKLLGATSLDIAKFEMKIAEDKTADMEEGAVKRLMLLKAGNKFAIATEENRLRIVGILHKAELNMLKTASASELYLLGIQQRRLENNIAQLQPFEQQNRLLDIQIQKEAALQQQILRRKDLYVTVMERILKASEEERKILEKVFTTLLPLEGAEFVKAFKRLDEEARALAISVQGIFTPFQRRAIVRARVELVGLERIGERIELAIERIPEIDTELMKAAELQIERLRLSPEAEKALGEAFRWVYTKEPTEVGEITPTGAIRWMKRVPIEKPFELPTPILEATAIIKSISIRLPETAPEKIAFKIGEQIAERLRTDPEFKKLFSQFFWTEDEKGH